MTNLVEEISIKSASLPSNIQLEILEFVDSVTAKDLHATPNGTPFNSVRGILKRELPNLEEDIAEIRKEMWTNFPREVVK